MEWSDEMDLRLLQSMNQQRPLGPEKHWRMLAISKAFNKRQPADSYIPADILLQRIGQLFDLGEFERLDAELSDSEDFPDRLRHKNMRWARLKESRDFCLYPAEEYDHLIHAKLSQQSPQLKLDSVSSSTHSLPALSSASSEQLLSQNQPTAIPSGRKRKLSVFGSDGELSVVEDEAVITEEEEDDQVSIVDNTLGEGSAIESGNLEQRTSVSAPSTVTRKRTRSSVTSTSVSSSSSKVTGQKSRQARNEVAGESAVSESSSPHDSKDLLMPPPVLPSGRVGKKSAASSLKKASRDPSPFNSPKLKSAQPANSQSVSVDPSPSATPAPPTTTERRTRAARSAKVTPAQPIATPGTQMETPATASATTTPAQETPAPSTRKTKRGK